MRRYVSLLRVLLLSGAIAGFAFAAPAFAQLPIIADVTSYGADTDPGTPSVDGPAIRAAIAAADAAPAGSVVRFPAGSYEIDVASSGDWFTLDMDGVTDIKMKGVGTAVLRFQNRDRYGIDLSNTDGVTFENLTLRYEDPCHFEGEITAWDDTLLRYTVVVSSGFPTSDSFLYGSTDRTWFFEPFDPITRRRIRDTRRAAVDDVTATGTTGTFYIDLDGDPGYEASVGDLAVVTVQRDEDDEDRPANLLFSEWDTDLTFEDVTILNSPYFAAQHNFSTNVTYEDCSIVPDPDLGSLGALQSTNRNGLRFLGNRRGPTITGCRFERCGDDPISIRGNWYRVLDVTPSGGGYELWLVNEEDDDWPIDFVSGDSLEVLDPTDLDMLSSRTVTGVADHPGGPGKDVTIAGFSQAPSVDDLIVNASAESNGFVVSNNTIREVRSRGIYARGRAYDSGSFIDNPTISDNVIAGTTLQGIVAASDLNFFRASCFSHDLRVFDNTVHNVGYKLGGAAATVTNLGAITVGQAHGDGDMSTNQAWPSGNENRDIAISGNWISTGRLAGVFLGSVDIAGVAGNHILNCQLDPVAAAGTLRGMSSGSVDGMIHLQNGIDVEHEDNVVDTSPFASMTPHVSVSSDTGTDGNTLDMDITESSTLPDATEVWATSFEQEEGWDPALPSFGSGGSGSTGPSYNATGSWSADIEGVDFSFSNWGLFGNHVEDHFYRGFIATHTATNGATMTLDLPDSATPATLRFWASVDPVPASSTWQLQVMTAASMLYVTQLTIDASTLPAAPGFAMYEVSLPSSADKIRFRSSGSGDAPDIYVDDVVVLFEE